MTRRYVRCSNLNHKRSKVPVRYCPMCGEVVNERIVSVECSEKEHAAQRRRGSTYCVDCGKRLVLTT